MEGDEGVQWMRSGVNRMGKSMWEKRGLSALSEHGSWGWSLRWNVSEELFAGSGLGGGCPRFGLISASSS